jgi:hypothetical protein
VTFKEGPSNLFVLRKEAEHSEHFIIIDPIIEAQKFFRRTDYYEYQFQHS